MVSGDRGPVGAVSCIPDFRDDGAFKSHRTRGADDVSIWSVMVVESATPTIDWADGFGLKIGTNADFTTSICSSSESSDSFISIVMFILISLCADDGGLEDDGRDDVGDKRDVLRCSGVWFEIVLDSDVRLVLCWMWCIGRPFIETLRKLAKSYGKNGFLHKNSGCPNGWNGDGKYVLDRVPACGEIIVAAECVDKIVGCVDATVCIGLNSLPSVGGNTVAGPAPGNDGDTAMKMNKKIAID